MIDIHTTLAPRGSEMHIIIASPLRGDRRSLERLMCKLERYLAFLKCEECVLQCGKPTVDNSTIIVKLHPESSPYAFELLEGNKQWVRNNDATLVIETDGIVDSIH